MTYDFWATAAIADEMRRTIAPGRVQQVLQVDAASLALEVYADRARRYLLLSADLHAPRVHLLRDKPRRGVDTASTLLQLLRKYVRGAALVDRACRARTLAQGPSEQRGPPRPGRCTARWTDGSTAMAVGVRAERCAGRTAFRSLPIRYWGLTSRCGSRLRGRRLPFRP